MTGHYIQNTDKEFKHQMKSHAASETNERKTACHQIFIFFFKSLIHISLGNSLQMIYRICEIQL